MGNFRRNNEDWILLRDLDQPAWQPPAEGGATTASSGPHGFFGAVCDGLGGGAFGEVASRASAETAADALLAACQEEGASLDAAATLRDAVTAAHRRIHRMMVENPAYDGMGTTFSGLWFRPGGVHLVHVGDSRIYRWRGRGLERMTTDQSPVGEMLARGRLTAEDARRHPMRNYVNQVIGGAHERVQPEQRSLPRVPGTLWLLCSDGLTDALGDDELGYALAAMAHLPPDRIAARLLHQALSRAGRDNISLLLVREGEPSLRTRLEGAARGRFRTLRQRFSRTPSSLR
ncbi:MAG: PP2C family protein-serine/threonine phosphatase [Opitutales bacterium]